MHAAAYERLSYQAHGGVIEDPYAFPPVRLDDEDRVLHGGPPFGAF
jgi:hypothetical protein